MREHGDPGDGPAQTRDPAGVLSEPEAQPPIAPEPDVPEVQRAEGTADNMLPGRERRRFGVERIFVRLVATFGVIAVGVLLGAILASSKVQGWIIGLVVASVSVIISAVLWSSRQL